MNKRSPNKHLPSRFRHLFVKKKRIMGSLTRSLNGQSPEFARWLIDQIPEGGTCADVMVAMAVDEYNSEEKNDDT